MEKTPLGELMENIQSSINGSVSKDQAEAFQNKNPVNNKELQSNPSAAVTGSKEEWERHGKENIENQLSCNQKDVENIAAFYEKQNRKLEVHDISVNDTFTAETSFYSLDDSNTTALNITDICYSFTNVLSISNEKQNSLQRENVSAHQHNYFDEGSNQVVQDDVKTIACEDETITSATSANNDANKRSSENAQGSSVITNLTFESKDKQKTENQQENKVVSCDNKNSKYHQNICDIKPAQTLTEGKNDDIACVENRADQSFANNEIISSLSHSQTEHLCLELQVTETNIESVAAVENSFISPLKCQIQGNNKPSGDVQSSPEEFNLTFEHEFEQTVIIHDEKQLDKIAQKEPTGDDDVNVPPGTEVRSTMSEQELEQNSISVSNGVNDRNSTSHCDTEVQIKQENKSCSDNVGSFPSGTSLEINLASELEQTDVIISDNVSAAENNMSTCNSEKQENVGSEKQIVMIQEETTLTVVSPVKNDICNTESTEELASEGTRTHQENLSSNINGEKRDNVGDIKQYPTGVTEENLRQEGNKTCDNIETDGKDWNFEKQINTTEEKTILDVASTEKAETYHQDFFGNISILKSDNIDVVQPNTTPMAEENLALEENKTCNNTETNMVDSKKQTDIVQETCIPNKKSGVCSDVNNISKLPVIKHIIHQEDSSSNVRNETGDNANDIEKYTTSVVGQDLVQEKNKICNDVTNRTINSDSKEQKIEDSQQQGETVQDKTILNVNPSVSKESGISEYLNAVEWPPEGNVADKDVIDVDNDKGVQGDQSNGQSSGKPRPSLLLGFDPIYASKSPNTTITEENCGNSDVDSPLLFGNLLGKVDINLHQISNQEIQESEAFFDALMSDDATNNVGKLIDISQIFPEEEKCSGSNLVCSLNETADMNTMHKVLQQVDQIAIDKEAGASDVPDSPPKNIDGKSIADVSGQLAIQKLKLQLGACHEAQSILQLQLRQKEEVILKTQEETLRKDEAYRQEINQLKAKLEEKCVVNDNPEAKELQETIKSLKNREAKLISDLNSYKSNEENYKKIMDEYEDTIGTRVAEVKRLSEEHETVKRHLANLEMAFSDVHQKYERSKKIIEGYKRNEDALQQTLNTSQETVLKSEQKYESLKSHAKVQMEKSNQAMHLMRQQSESEIHKLNAIIKRLEIMNASIKESLDQKAKECVALAALCDEVTGKV